MPGQQGSRGHDPVQPKMPGQQPHQSREHGTVSPVRLRARDLPAQHRDFVPQHQDLRVLGGVTARQERQPAEHADHEQADGRMSTNAERKAAGQTMRRVLAQHSPDVRDMTGGRR